jgi:hypothetical protein
VTKIREKLAVSKQTTHMVHMDRFYLEKLKDIEGKEQYHIEISNGSAALESLDAEIDINRA